MQKQSKIFDSLRTNDMFRRDSQWLNEIITRERELQPKNEKRYWIERENNI